MAPNTIILLSMEKEVTGPRDKVYGLLSLLDKRVAMQIAIDVKKSALEVYTDFTRCVLEEYQDPALLLFANASNSTILAYHLGPSTLLDH